MEILFPSAMPLSMQRAQVPRLRKSLLSQSPKSSQARRGAPGRTPENRICVVETASVLRTEILLSGVFYMTRND